MNSQPTMKRIFFESAAVSLIASLGLFGLFMALEPNVGQAVEDQFTVKQTVTEEISFTTPAQDIVLSPSLSGITGGTSNGSTYVIVRTNDTLGYNMTLVASGSPAMQGDTQGDSISNFSTTSGHMGSPHFDFTTSEVLATPGHGFAYTVEASTTADMDANFLDDGGDCGTGATDTVDSCWAPASTTAYQIVNRGTATPNSGATTTLKFRVVMRSDATDITAEDTYTATTTLTATNN